MTRREAIGSLAAVAPSGIAPEVVRRHDANLERLLQTQVVDPGSKWRGACPDADGLHQPHSAGSVFANATAAYCHPGSSHYRRRELIGRLRLAAAHLVSRQSPAGNVDLLITNFNSPPDTGFVVHGMAAAAAIARRAGERDIEALAEPFLLRAAKGLAAGGVHTPNHRWVVCSALAQINALYPDPAFLRRIDQWLGEGIDIDGDGQFNERSTLVYNAVTDRALVVLAAKLGRPELLEPVRANLESMLYLLHPGGEVVTEISRRQDANQRGTMAPYWFPLRYLAIRDRDGRWASLARSFEHEAASLPVLMEYPELLEPPPPDRPLPDNYERRLPSVGIARIRRGLTSATLVLGGASRFLSLRRGEAVVNGVRFASAFFGKGQFVPREARKQDRSYHFRQSLEAGYYQPLEPSERVPAERWAAVRVRRRQTETCRLHQAAQVTETDRGFQVRLRAEGTAGVPVAVEISLREGGELKGCDGPLLVSGYAEYRAGSDSIRFGPGAAPHRYVSVRGAEAPLPGRGVYITGYTPFDHTLEFDLNPPSAGTPAR